jgi:hypothetical protein
MKLKKADTGHEAEIISIKEKLLVKYFTHHTRLVLQSITGLKLRGMWYEARGRPGIPSLGLRLWSKGLLQVTTREFKTLERKDVLVLNTISSRFKELLSCETQEGYRVWEKDMYALSFRGILPRNMM